MKFSIQREALLKPLQNVIGVVERRQTLPVLGNVLLNASRKNVRLTATDLEVELQAQVAVSVTETGDITLPARKLLDICRTLPDEAQLDISVKKDRAQVSSGKSRFTLSTLPATEFPVIDKIKSARKFMLSEKQLRSLIEHTGFAMAQQDVRYYLNGLMLEPGSGMLRAVATDGHRLALCDLAADVGEGDSQQVIVPRKGIQELQRLLEQADTELEVEIGSNHIRITTNELRFTSKLIDGRFPDYSRVIPKSLDKRLLISRETLRQALTRTSILSNEKYRGIRLEIYKNNIKIQAHNPEQEEAVEEIDANYDNEAIVIGFNVTYLLDVLNVIDTSEVEVFLADANSSALVRRPGSDDCRYVVMPMRL
ncbi:MAG: DNA polymerase III subunit beta [Gammaproteobacteria bacterium]|jgi:DNA polymerase-3 subunit beta|nr:DNA polymerase III subunit beta [Gammaproteobacteria bacterium]